MMLETARVLDFLEEGQQYFSYPDLIIKKKIKLCYTYLTFVSSVAYFPL